ncbi:LysR family transcriptional regulator [Rhodococcus rhodnii]|uniref:LysR family transcriptional regulator n=2 Tax=Rhodococcus rhodnii TaxID=38312 RepID=R7WP12_9NOCA|nr:LysR family transcriptional regulator [Rhodococcus rhodnii]EOM77053.1 LysR family transcriptional regulator [Rhodococcus rhodnii LMG 5362]TXG89880.1 LysR family transcriptional regulator [Rhodococcus rhodnii]
MPSPYTLVQLRHFVVVAEVGSVTHAARRLGVTQSALSASIARLEREFDATLFTRSPRRGLEPTTAGRRLLHEAIPFLETADRLYAVVHGDPDDLTGELVVGVFAPLAAFRAPVILSAIEKRHPNLHVTLLEGDQEFVRRALHEGRCELALMYDIGLDPGLETTVVERIPPHVVVPEGHRLADAPDAEVSLVDLADDPLILLDLPHTREYFFSLYRSVGATPRVRHRASNYETVRAFVGQGHGYAVLNQRLHHTLTYSGSRIVPLRLTDDLPPIEVLLARVPGTTPTLRAAAFAAVCRSLYGLPTGSVRSV